MITFLDGILEELQPTRAVMNLGGVGYEIAIPLSSHDSLPRPGEQCRLLIYDYVREDQHSLFGFATEKERQMFTTLLGVSGIGPRLALSALSGLTVRELTSAILEGDARRLNAIPGVGKKMAERMIVELKDRIDEADAMQAVAGGDEEGGSHARDAALALEALGYKSADARKMVEAVLKDGKASDNVEDIIRRALAR